MLEAALALGVFGASLLGGYGRATGAQANWQVRRGGEKIAALEGRRRVTQREHATARSRAREPGFGRDSLGGETPRRRRDARPLSQQVGVGRQRGVGQGALGKTAGQQDGRVDDAGGGQRGTRSKRAQRVQPVGQLAPETFERIGARGYLGKTGGAALPR